MDRDSLRDFPLELYDVTVSFTRFEQDRAIEWTILTDFLDPPLGHVYGYEPRTRSTVERRSPRTTTGPRSTRCIANESRFRSSRSRRCGQPSASSPGPWLRGAAAGPSTVRASGAARRAADFTVARPRISSTWRACQANPDGLACVRPLRAAGRVTDRRRADSVSPRRAGTASRSRRPRSTSATGSARRVTGLSAHRRPAIASGPERSVPTSRGGSRRWAAASPASNLATRSTATTCR